MFHALIEDTNGKITICGHDHNSEREASKCADRVKVGQYFGQNRERVKSKSYIDRDDLRFISYSVFGENN
jgi:hypothetical protein